MANREPLNESAAAGGVFVTTRWSVVWNVCHENPDAAADARETLCRTYWTPIYFYVRRRGYNEHDAKDLTQGFFAQLLRRGAFDHVERGPAKFRSFLLGSVKNFLADEHARATALKRGGGQPVLSLDTMDVETSYKLEPVEHVTPEVLFDRQWAISVLNAALAQLAEERAAAGKVELFNALRSHIVDGMDDRTYAEIATQLGMSEEAVKKSAQRLGHRFQKIIRDAVGATVNSSTEVEEELRYLWSVIGSR